MRRVAWLLRRGGGPVAFATAGRGLAQAIVATRGGELPAWCDELAEAMVGSLIVVLDASRWADDPAFRAQLATAAATLSLVRPAFSRRCDEAVATWLGDGLDAPAGRDGDTALTARALFALWVDDCEAAAAAVATVGECPASGALHDWIVARTQRHGAGREIECFHHLRLALGDTRDPRGRAPLVLLAAVVLWERLRVPRCRALAWLDEVADPVPARVAS